MARRSLLSEHEETTEINLSSMIDCIFILLIFFIVTTVFVEETGLEVNKPDAGSPSDNDEENEVVMLEITSSNKVLINGEEIPISQVKTKVKEGMKNSETPVSIRAHEGSRHGVLISVWDEATLGGAQQLSFTTTN
ncbi:ExbD/TolR family protein [Cerasicoccus arenae]|uniref:Biopolymer transporter ExbD n=1 Tax=Cerasicoccus arenae TaxID=424488 RepID=A0A8J3GCX7_9BACT|nr:biopolymer transporter ExbD [Cerasicoccus arenae]MBK1858258.1 biopolymer transporter ExbD [Cerasicoccus arenae]GHC02222.1 biopolymer transporter ExbD [Cerasicoccus arenae]